MIFENEEGLWGCGPTSHTADTGSIPALPNPTSGTREVLQIVSCSPAFVILQEHVEKFIKGCLYASAALSLA